MSKPGEMSLTRYGRTLLPILLATSLAVALGAALVLHFSRTLARNAEALQHAHAVVDKASALLAQVEHGEAAQRVYLANGHAGALSAFTQASRDADELAGELVQLTTASPRQRVRSDYLKAQVTVRRELLRRGADAAQAQGFGGQRMAGSREGQELMAVIRTTVDEIVADENAALTERMSANAASERRTLYVGVGALLVAFSALMLGALLAARRFGQIRAARRASAHRAAALQKTLDHARDGVAAFDAERRLIAFNPLFFRLMQVPERLAVLGTPAAELCRSTPLSDMPELVEALFAHPDPSAMQSLVTIGGRTLEISQSRAIDGSVIVSCRPAPKSA